LKDCIKAKNSMLAIKIINILPEVKVQIDTLANLASSLVIDEPEKFLEVLKSSDIISKITHEQGSLD
jgi:hypothetical protein